MLHVSRLLRSRAPSSLARQPSSSLMPSMATRAFTSKAATDDQSWMGYGFGAAALLLAGGASMNQTDNCGIVGVVSKHQEANTFLLEGLTILQNRGYDSAGMATSKHDGGLPITVTKFASVQGTADSINLLRETKDDHAKNTVGIAHTRWATHGGKTDENSHPHLDQNKRVAVVHNGTITNYNELKNELVEAGVKFSSQTDTEVIAQLIGQIMNEGADCLTATRLALGRLEGTWGLCVMARDEPGKVIVARNGSPLCIGYGSNSMYIASETTAFTRHTKRFLSLQDGEVAVVKADTAELNPTHPDDLTTLQRFPTSRLGTAPDVKVRLSPAPFPHWTIREIMEQPKAVASSLGYGGRVSDDHVYLGGLEAEKDKMLKIKHLLISACGTSLNAGKYGAKIMRTLGAFDSVSAEDAGECTNERLPRHDGGLLVVSQSGETKDVHRVLQLQGAQEMPMFSVVNSVGSLIARTTKCGVYLNAGRENAVASTKAFVTQVTVLGLIAAWFAQNRPESVNRGKLDELIQSLHRLPITIGMALRTRAQCIEVAQKLMPSEHLFVLGKGYGEPIAYEGALKIKEITYLHAEGYSGGALKHGPFALIEGKEGQFGPTPIILVVLDDEHGHLMKTAAEEVRARGAYTIVITDNPAMCEGIADSIIPIPNNGPMTALLASIPLQLIAYELAVKRGINPDVPRNLAKAVTVD
ncbi:hypothetical protein DYB28_004239 [Aphanomyces astaci]|uniref:Glutamine--fructose-6-phosphate aminotransferase [isomerizing] n=1 Tax=Aphanomyces astaci TaxID=112090 RepID=A0A397A8U2_APHAT|nr:hypothetical protein AaE_005169 [Aphanomyces astaci]RHY02715.1 hypothetical protein DYB25_001336 [Aphanomyces astaci]RLO01056.1 hypothetical protein DYB28_004239 [Aphanomyces astaci]